MSYISRGNPYGFFEKQTFSPDGILDTFTLNYRPGQSGALLVVYGGAIQEPGTSYILIDGGRKIKFTFIPEAGQLLYVLYLGRELSIPTVSGNYPIHETAIGDGLNTHFTLPVTPAEAALMVYIDGILKGFGEHWTLVGNQVAFITPPLVGAKIDFYIHGVERLDVSTVDDGSITASKLNLFYLPFTPSIITFNGMNHTTPSFTVSKFLPLGNFVKLRLLFSTTFSDVPHNTVRFTLPTGYENDGSGLVSGSVTLSNSSTLETGILRWGSLNSIDIKRQNNIDYTVGDAWTFEIALDYDLG
jgi:hypothetical protein